MKNALQTMGLRDVASGMLGMWAKAAGLQILASVGCMAFHYGSTGKPWKIGILLFWVHLAEGKLDVHTNEGASMWHRYTAP